MKPVNVRQQAWYLLPYCTKYLGECIMALQLTLGDNFCDFSCLPAFSFLEVVPMFIKWWLVFLDARKSWNKMNCKSMWLQSNRSKHFCSSSVVCRWWGLCREDWQR